MDWTMLWLALSCCAWGFITCCCAAPSLFCGNCADALGNTGSWSVTVSGCVAGGCSTPECNKLNVTYVIPNVITNCQWSIMAISGLVDGPSCSGNDPNNASVLLYSTGGNGFRQFSVSTEAVGGSSYVWEEQNTDTDCITVFSAGVTIAFSAAPVSFSNQCDCSGSTCSATYTP